MAIETTKTENPIKKPKRTGAFKKLFLASSLAAALTFSGNSLAQEQNSECKALKQKIEWQYSECDKGRTDFCNYVRSTQKTYDEKCLAKPEPAKVNCDALAKESKAASDACRNNNQAACAEHQRIITERVEKCMGNEQKPAKKADKKECAEIERKMKKCTDQMHHPNYPDKLNKALNKLTAEYEAKCVGNN